jgi:3',5'-cyclic AMP phosphodiesterase CpdA
MSRDIVLFHASDLHFGAQDREALDWFAAEVAAHRPDGVVCTGDLTMRGRAREFAAAAEYLGALAAPVSVEPGNHDMPYYWDPVRRLARPWDRFRALHAAVHSDLALGPVAVIPLRTVARAQWRINWSKGRVGPASLGEALHHLHAAQGAALRVVACHHPLIDAGTHSTGSTRGGTRALAALARAGAQVVLSGHVHDPFERAIEVDGHAMRMIGAGTLSQRLRVTRPSYNRLEWSASAGLSLSVQTLA